MKKLLFVALAIFGLQSAVQAQYYKKSLGLRINDGYAGVTYKYFTSAKSALDFTLNVDFDSGFGLTGLYEIHVPTNLAPRLSWYYGVGAHGHLAGGDNGSNSIGLGVDGVIGLEYAASEIPVAFSVDYIPSFSVTTVSEPDNWPDNVDWDGTSSGFNFENWTVGIKYTFIKSGATEKKEEEDKKKNTPK